MMRILAIDTSADFGSIALVEDGRVVEETPLHSSDGFAHVLFDAVRTLLERHDWTLAGLDGVAAAAGPGSFTGVRVGLAAAKGLADVLGKPMAGVSNLRALASFGTGSRRAVLLDARRGEIYGAVYGADGLVQGEEAVMKFPDWLSALPEGITELITPTPAIFAPLLAGTRLAECTVVAAPRAIAGAVGCIASQMELVDAVGIDANYVRRSDAELFWKDA
jgi:tRNA threonylcarbamoyladenosine biosynthesis protein TsaB